MSSDNFSALLTTIVSLAQTSIIFYFIHALKSYMIERLRAFGPEPLLVKKTETEIPNE